MKVGNEAADGKLLGDLIFVVNDIQLHFPISLIQPSNKFLVAALNFIFEFTEFLL